MEAKTVVLGADQKVAKVEFADGTIFERLGPQRWIANADHPRSHEWVGDVIVAPSGKLKFQYKYAKTLSQCNLEIRFQDGRKLARRDESGKYFCPSTLNSPSIKTLEETALSSISALNVHVYEGAKRLRLTGVTSAEGMLNINYLLVLNSTEERPIVQAVKQANETNKDGVQFEIISGEKVLPYAPPPSAFKDTSEKSDAPRSHSFHSETTFYYDEPRAEHTATTVIFFIHEKTNRLKVVTGIRGGDPFKGREALPGGFVDVRGDTVENVYDAAAREVKEETGATVQKLQLLRVADARKDPRNQVIDSQFIAKISEREFEQLQAGDDIADLHARDVAELLANPDQLAFDHGEALAFALAACKTRPELRLAAFNTARDAQYNKAILNLSNKMPPAHQTPEKTKAEEALSTLVQSVLSFLKQQDTSAKKEEMRTKIEDEIKRLTPSISSSDMEYIRAKVMQIQYEEIDYALSKAGWNAAIGSDGSMSGSFMKGAVFIDPTQAKAFGPEKMQMDDPITVPADVTAAISIAASYAELSPVDRDTIKNLEKVLQSDLEQRSLLENGYKKAIGDAEYTKPSLIIAFLLSYCGRKPEDASS